MLRGQTQIHKYIQKPGQYREISRRKAKAKRNFASAAGDNKEKNLSTNIKGKIRKKCWREQDKRRRCDHAHNKTRFIKEV